MTIVWVDKLRDWHSDRGRGSKCQIFCGRHRRTDRNGFLSSDRNRTICLFYAYFTAYLDDRVGVNREEGVKGSKSYARVKPCYSIQDYFG